MGYDYEEGFEKRPFWTLTRVLVLLLCSLTAVGVVGCFLHTITNPVQQGARVVNKIIDADNMLTQYKWFHDTSASLDLFPNKIKNAAALERWAEVNDKDRAMARQTELTGVMQTCLDWVGQYNSRAARLDAGFFRNPERWLPASTSAWTPLPSSYPPNWCDPPAAK